jgi:hypothetical protein
VPYFKDLKEMEDIQKAFFEKVASDPDVGPKLRAAGLVIRFQVHDPIGTVTIDCRGETGEGRYLTAVFGESGLRPDITLTCSADLSHELWLGKINVINALFTGKVKASGDVSQAMKIVPVLTPVAGIYKEVLTSLGRQDLILE